MCLMTKKRLFFLLGMFVPAVVSYAALSADLSLHESQLSTKDGLCSISYLTDRDTTGWYIETDTQKCVDGLADGYTSVVVKNALAQTVEVLAGSFISGYRTDKIWAKGRMLSRFSTKSDTQSFLFQPDEMLTDSDVVYALQFDAIRQKNGFYGAFQACQPVRVFAITDAPELFDDDTARNQIMTEVRQHVIAICPDAQEVSLSALSEMTPQEDNIFFKATLNFKTQEVVLHKTPFSESYIPYPTQIRQENGIALMIVHPILPEAPLPETAPVLEEEEDTAAQFSEAMAEITNVMQEDVSEKTTQPSVESVNPLVLPVLPTDKRDDVLKLMVLSRVQHAPVHGRAVVRVAAVRPNGEGLTDAPMTLYLKGAPVSAGWGIVTGRFSDIRQEGYKRVRRVDVETFTPCLTPMCVREGGDE